MVIVRFIVAIVLVLVGLLWIGQGLGFIPGSFMSAQPVYAILGAVLVVTGVVLAWRSRRSTAH